MTNKGFKNNQSMRETRHIDNYHPYLVSNMKGNERKVPFDNFWGLHA